MGAAEEMHWPTSMRSRERRSDLTLAFQEGCDGRRARASSRKKESGECAMRKGAKLKGIWAPAPPTNSEEQALLALQEW